MDLGVADDGERAGNEQAAQIAVASFADAAEPVLTSAPVLLLNATECVRLATTRGKAI